MGRMSSYTFVLVLATTLIMLCHRASSVSCDFATYPDLCTRTLATTSGSSSSSTPNVINTLYDLINVTLSRTNLRITSKYVDMLTSRFTSRQARLARNAMRKCHSLMRMSEKSLKRSLEALRKESLGQLDKEDIQTWLSATITYQQACMDAVGPHMGTNAYLSRLHSRMEHLSMLSSNPLALVNRLMVGGQGRRRRLLGFPGPGMKPDVVVAKDGSGDCTTVGEAIGRANGVDRFVIYVKTGKYREKVKVDKDFITLVGDGMFASIITSDGSVDKGFVLGDTATFIITGDHFMAQDIGFFNTAGPQAGQALALSVASDQSVFHRCSIASYQDTLYALSNRQFYSECRIYGTIDFIFGNAAAVFQNSTIVLRRPLHGASNVILANGRTSSDQNTGFVLQNCSIIPGRELIPVQSSYNSYLGRPWKEYSRAVVMQSYIDGAISSEGWIMWQWASYYSTLYFAEFWNVGPGSGTQSRVSWPGYHVIGANEAMQFTVGSFIGGESWLPSMGVGYIPGLQ